MSEDVDVLAFKWAWKKDAAYVVRGFIITVTAAGGVSGKKDGCIDSFFWEINCSKFFLYFCFGVMRIAEPKDNPGVFLPIWQVITCLFNNSLGFPIYYLLWN